MEGHIEQILKKLIDLDLKASEQEKQNGLLIKSLQDKWQDEIKRYNEKINESNLKGKKLYEDILKQAEEEKVRVLEITDKKLEEMEKEFNLIKSVILKDSLKKILFDERNSYE